MPSPAQLPVTKPTGTPDLAKEGHTVAAAVVAPVPHPVNNNQNELAGAAFVGSVCTIKKETE